MSDRIKLEARDRQEKWDRRFLEMAALVATWSKDPSTKVGAVIVRPDKTVCSVGFNGFPRGVPDAEEWLLDRATKYAYTVHAEINAILTSNEPVRGTTLYTTFHPCSGCAPVIVQAGITRVVVLADEPPQRWADNFVKAGAVFALAGVRVDLIERRD